MNVPKSNLKPAVPGQIPVGVRNDSEVLARRLSLPTGRTSSRLAKVVEPVADRVRASRMGQAPMAKGDRVVRKPR